MRPEAGSASWRAAGFHRCARSVCPRQVPARPAVADHGVHVPGSHTGLGLTHTDRHLDPHLDIFLQSRVFWRRVTGESEALTAGAAVLWVRQGVVSTQHRPSATSEDGADSGQ